MTQLTNSERQLLSTEVDGVHFGPQEKAQCEHGRFYSYRWVWGDDIRDGEIEVLEWNCTLCGDES